MNQFTRRTARLVAMIGGASLLALMASPASAKTIKLHFFQKATSATFTGPDGTALQPPSATNPPVVGEKFTSTDDDFVGNHKKHAKKFTASDHIACTFIDAMGTATCDAQIALGGSLLFADHVTVRFGPSVVVPITGGTGAYKHARGTTTSVSVGNSANSDFTVTITI